MRNFLSYSLLLMAILMVSCNKSTNTETPSSVAELRSFAFAAQDSFPGLVKARFTIKELPDTSLVYNEDSIQYGTSLKRVVPKFTFAATLSSAILYMPDSTGLKCDTFVLSGNDSLDFTRQPAILTIRSQDGSNIKTYRITATVHQVDPDLYQWQMLSDSICPPDYEQQTLSLGSQFICLANNGYQTLVTSSTDGVVWTNLGAITSLPDVCHVRSIISDGTTLYYTDSNILYTSTNGVDWTSVTNNLSGCFVHTMLMAFNELVWTVVEKPDGDLCLATFDGSALALTDLLLSPTFPIGSFATVTFPGTTNRARALVLGGYTRDGQSINHRWAFEYSSVEDVYRIKDFTVEQPNFTSLTGASMVWYDNKIFLFGGINDDAKYMSSSVFYSQDEGMNWQLPDTTKFYIGPDYEIRQKQSALVRDNNIYLFGGESRNYYFSDVYCGRLNSIDWEK